MSIVRVGLAETRNFAQGWDTIFAKGKKGKKTTAASARKKKGKRAKKK